jgi:hypothetical protein
MHMTKDPKHRERIEEPNLTRVVFMYTECIPIFSFSFFRSRMLGPNTSVLLTYTEGT